MSMRPLISNICVFLLAPGAALAAPGIPEAFHGAVSGAVGANITALIAGRVVASTTVESSGLYGYMPHLFIIPDSASTQAGASISFAIGTAPAMQSAVFANGAIVALDLSTSGTTTALLSVATSTILLPQIIVTSGATNLPTPKPIHILLSRRYDLTGDRKIDLTDFTYLLAHWGEAGEGTPADINADGIVNLLDFNLLISHWSI